MALLRDGLLAQRAIATVAVPDAVTVALGRLGARVEELRPDPGLGEDEEAVGAWARERSPLHALVLGAGAGTATDAVWACVREVAVGALIPGAGAGKVILIAPRADPPLAAALESLARTLSVEWARFGVSAVTVAPGRHSGGEEVAQVVCFLCSRAGEYLSGCVLRMR